MSSQSIPPRAAHLRAAGQAITNSAFEADARVATGGDKLFNGWFDSSFELRRGLDVIEWVLPDPAADVEPFTPAQ
jgi:hypothetical protein